MVVFVLQIESFFTVEFFIADEPAKFFLTDSGLIEMGKDSIESGLSCISFPTSGLNR